MIENIRHKGLRKFHEKGERSGLNAKMISRIEEILSILEAAETVQETDIPGYRLHSLAGDKRRLWSVRVTGNWRIVFRFEDGAAYDVDLVDYH